MSIPVELPALSEAMARYRFAYLLTQPGHGAPHAVAVVPLLEGGLLKIGDTGRRTRENLLARPEVGLVWPPAEASGYSLIVDGRAALVDGAVHVTPARAVLHRPAPNPGPAAAGGCGSDCVELPVAAAGPAA